MITGVSKAMRQDLAEFTLQTGTAHADYPVTNLADAKEILRPFKAGAAAALEIRFVLDAAAEIDFIALAHHNAEGGETWSVELFSDAAFSSSVYASGALVFQVAASQFPRTEPHWRSDGPVSVQSGAITLSAQTAPWKIGAIVIGQFWDLSQHDERSLGILPRDGRLGVGDGVTHGTRNFSPRTFTLGNSQIDWTTDGRTFHDFQRATQTAQPFVWLRDYEDTDTWPRECALVRSKTLPALDKNAWIHGGLALDMVEHLE
jgi:hypothetical protein